MSGKYHLSVGAIFDMGKDNRSGKMTATVLIDGHLFGFFFYELVKA
jgi:hypothetical protein